MADNDKPVITVNGDGFTYERPTVGIPAGGINASAIAADMDGDGDLDIVVLDSSQDKISWYANDGQGNVSGTANTLDVSVFGLSLEVADVDGDGKKDFVVTQNGTASNGTDAGKVVWYKSNGDGTFAAAQEVVSGKLNPYDTEAVDFDGDGDIDLLTVATGESNTVTLSLNDGAGNFTNSQIATGVVSPQAIRVLDINGDGRLDILTAGSLSIAPEGYAVGSAVGVAINNGDGTYTQQVLDAGYSPSTWDIEVADIDGDGKLDIVSTQPNTSEVTWFKNNGDGTFGSAVAIGNQQPYGRVDSALGDIDGDGDIDLVTTESDIGNSTTKVSWFENDGSGNFTEHRTDLAIDAEGTVALADLDGNGTLDIIRGGRAGTSFDDRNTADVSLGFKTISVLENSASALTGISFNDTTTGSSVTVNLSVPSGTLTAVSANGVTVAGTETGTLTLTGSLADINAFIAAEHVTFTTALDSETDVKLSISIDDGVTGDAQSASTTVLLDVAPANEAPTIHIDADIVFERPTVGIPSNGVYASAQAHDMDGDGDLDVVVLNSSSRTIEWYANDGHGNIAATAATVALTGYPSSLEIVDLNGDGVDDLLVTQSSDDNPADGAVTWMAGNGDGTFGAAQTVVGGQNNPYDTVSIDFDNDGDLDVISVASNDHNKVTISTNDGSGNFTNQELDIGVGAPQVVRVVDLNGDGKLDIINAGIASITPEGIGEGAAINVSLNNGDGTFTTTTTNMGATPSIWDVEIADMDGDGVLDMVVTYPNVDDSLLLMKGNGDGTFGAPVTIGTDQGTRTDAAIGDIDGDGDLDIVASENDEGSGSIKRVSWFENDGSGHFTEHKTDLYINSMGSVELADLDNDGLLDIIRGGRSGENAQSRNTADVTLAHKVLAVEENTPTALTGISFADSQTGATVTVTLSAASGTLHADTGSGVTVVGDGTGSLTLTGSLADINAFLAGENATFTTALNADEDVKLDITIDDGVAGHAKSATTSITLDVVAPDLAPTDLALTGNSVPEESPVGTVIGTLSATDPEGAALTYTLTDDAGGKFSLVTEGTGPTAVVKLVVAGMLDYETGGPTYQIGVKVSDGHNEVTKNFDIAVTDVVENLAPTDIALSNSEVSEDAAVGAVIGTLSATDPEGQPLTYTLTDDADGRFELVGTELRLKAGLDYEAHTNHLIKAAVSDGVNETIQEFNIGVKDVDDGVQPVGTITIDASGSGASGMSFEAFIRGGFSADATSGGFPVFDNGGEFAGEEMMLAYGPDATSKYVMAHGEIEYSFATHTVAGEINTIEFGTKGSGTYDSNGYFSGGNVQLKITGLDFANPLPGVGGTEAEIEATGSVHNFTVAYMYGAAGDAARYNLFADQLDAYAQHFIGSTGADVYQGTQSDDTIEGNGGNDTFDGGLGNDTIKFSSARAGFEIVVGGNGTATITNKTTGDVTTLTGVETALFNDVVVNLQDGSEEPIGGNLPPTDIELSANKIAEDAAIGAVVGKLSATDPEGDAITWTIAGGASKFFEIVGDELRVKSGLDFETSASHTITVRATDSADNFTDQIFSISVTDVIDVVTGTSKGETLRGGIGIDQLLGKGGNDILIGGAGADILQGGTGKDTASYANAQEGVTASLANASLNKGDAKGDSYASIENLTGSSFNDKLFGDAGANVLRGGGGADVLQGGKGADELYGGAGNDRLVGGKGADDLYGGAGKDTFVFNSIADSKVAASGRDTIFDFHGGQGDRIDLSAIDANTHKAKDQDFDFIGKHDFSHTAGELRYEKTGSGTFVYGDTNGDGKADFALHFDDAVNLKADFFLL